MFISEIVTTPKTARALFEDQEARKITSAVIDFYKHDVGPIQAEPVEDYNKQANELLRKAEPSIRDRVREILVKAKTNPYLQGGIITTVGALLTGGLLSTASQMHLSPAQTNILLQAVLNTVIPTVVSRVNGKNWIDTIKYTLASAGIGTGIALVSEKDNTQINELGNAPADYKANRKRKNSLFHATVEGHWVDVFFDRSEFNGTLHITFTVNGDYDAPSQPTSASKSTVKILSTVLNVVKQKLPEYIKKSRPPAISFTSKQDNRTNLYRKYFVPVIQDILGAKWQHEEYPSMGMTVFHWRPVKKSDVTEAFDQPYAIQWTKQNGDWHATADLDDGSELIVLFMSQGDNQWMVEFERDENMEITGEGDAPRVFATVLTAMRQFIAKRKPAMLNFSAEKEDDPTGSRARLYDRMVQRYITGTGYDLTRQDYPGGATYTLTKQAQGVAEVFNQPYGFKWDHGEFGDYDALTRLPDGTNLNIMFNSEDNDEWQVEFYRNNSQEVTGAGDQQRVFATVLEAIRQFIEMQDPERIRFSANKEVEPGQKSLSRSNLYSSLVRRYARSLGYAAEENDFGNRTVYDLEKIR